MTRRRALRLIALVIVASLALAGGTSVPAAARPAKPKVAWTWNGSTWQTSGKPPACPSPLISAPVDLTMADSRLLPGQFRGGTDPMSNFKTHGGFGFPAASNGAVTVTAPADGTLVKASRYLEGNDAELQYSLFVVMPCGYLYKFDHIAALGPALGGLDAQLPAARPDDSRTTPLARPIAIRKGAVLGTAVGFAKQDNFFIDFGMYDLRRLNDAARTNSEFRAQMAPAKEFAYYGVCFFTLLPGAQAAQASALPLRGSESTSYYCR